jgi:hypothetical protein
VVFPYYALTISSTEKWIFEFQRPLVPVGNCGPERQILFGGNEQKLSSI